MALADATIDHRVKAVATFSLYDMTESIGHGLNHAYTEENRQKCTMTWHKTMGCYR